MWDHTKNWCIQTYYQIFKLKGSYNHYFDPSLLTIVLTVWLFEWLLIIEYIFGEWWRTSILFPSRLSLGLLICVFYWTYLWGMAVWRRTQFGKFTRGERKLWAKAITSFWVAELVTIASFILIYLWLSWGPAPLVARRFLMSRKGIIIELVVYTYIIFLAYVAKLALKWNLWKFQLSLSLIITIIFSYLLWKDLLLLLLRDNLYNNTTAKWRSIRLTAVANTLSHEWWTTHIIGTRAVNSPYPALRVALLTKTHPFHTAAPILTEYETNNFLHTVLMSQRTSKIYPLLSAGADYNSSHHLFNPYYFEQTFYPRRTGFIPKRLAMWQLLMILKMWHHLIILLWWTLYTYKLLFRRKTSYAILNVCYFNVYCCYILALMIYFLYIASFLELYLKFRPNTLNIHRLILLTNYALAYIYRLFVDSNYEDYAIIFDNERMHPKKKPTQPFPWPWNIYDKPCVVKAKDDQFWMPY